jgi:hypothetical protein
VKKKTFVGVVVFEKRFEAIVEGNAWPWHKDKRNSSVLKI